MAAPILVRLQAIGRFVAPQGKKLRAAGDLKQSSTTRAAEVSTRINLPTRDIFPSAIRSLLAMCSAGPLGFAKAGRGEAYE